MKRNTSALLFLAFFSYWLEMSAQQSMSTSANHILMIVDSSGILVDSLPIEREEEKFFVSTTDILEPIQASLTYEQAIIEYLVNIDKISARCLTADTIWQVDWDVANLNRRVDAFRKSLDQIRPEYVEQSKKLYKLLAEPIFSFLPPHIKWLQVVPDGVLWNIPFEALHDGRKTLLDSYIISYAFQPNAIKIAEDSISKDIKLLAVAPSFDNDPMYTDSVLHLEIRIPEFQNEADVVADYLNSSPVLGQSATETFFKENASKYDMLHLATVGLIDSDGLGQPVILLRSDAVNDGLLMGKDLLSLDLRAKMALISDFGIVPGIQTSAALESFSTAFIEAGVPALVIGLWPTSDESSPQVLNHFYQNLSYGQRKDEALSSAKKQYLANAEGAARHPHYWSSFVLIGDVSPVYPKEPIWVFVLGVLFLIVVVPIIVIVKQKFLTLK